MSLVSAFGGLLRKAANLILDVDDTAVPVEQLRVLQDMSSRHRLQAIDPADLRELVEVLRRKHAVDAIIVANRNGSMVVSSDENLDTEALTGTALFNYVRAEIPESDVILVRARDWCMLFPYQDKVYILRAGSSLSTIEMHAIAREIEAFVKAKAAPSAAPKAESESRAEAEAGAAEGRKLL